MLWLDNSYLPVYYKFKTSHILLYFNGGSHAAQASLEHIYMVRDDPELLILLLLPLRHWDYKHVSSLCHIHIYC